MWTIHTSIAAVGTAGAAIASGVTPSPIAAGAWHTYRADVNGSAMSVWVDGVPVVAAANVSGLATSGHFAIGQRAYATPGTQYDNVQLYSTVAQCGGTAPAVGTPVSLVSLASEVGPRASAQWDFAPLAPGGWNGTYALRAAPALCLAVAPPDATGAQWLVLATCSAADPAQVFQWNFEGIAPDNERKSAIVNTASGRCIDIFGTIADIGLPADAYPCNGASNQAFFYDFGTAEIATEAAVVALGVC